MLLPFVSRSSKPTYVTQLIRSSLVPLSAFCDIHRLELITSRQAYTPFGHASTAVCAFTPARTMQSASVVLSRILELCLNVCVREFRRSRLCSNGITCLYVRSEARSQHLPSEISMTDIWQYWNNSRSAVSPAPPMSVDADFFRDLALGTIHTPHSGDFGEIL